MKHTFRRLTALLLSALLLVSLSVPAAFAENGPCPSPWFTFLGFTVLDENGEPIMETVDGWEQNKQVPVYVPETKTEPVNGAVYDQKTNTLTLTDFNHPNYALFARMMGDDFTLCVKGECSIAKITISGEEWGGSLHISGDGLLTVNGKKNAESGVFLAGYYTDKLAFTVEGDVRGSIYGTKTAVEVYGLDGELTATAGGEAIPLNKTNAVREQYVRLEGYSNPWKENLRLCRNAADPEGLYSLYEWESANGETYVTVEHYVFDAPHDLYLLDHHWQEDAAEGETPSELRFATVEEAAAAGFTLILSDEGEPVWRTVDSMGNHGSEQVYQDEAGRRYIKSYAYDENDQPYDIACSVEPLASVPGEYLFLEAPGVDPETLTEETEIVTYDEMFDYAYPGTEFTFGEEPQPDALILNRIDIKVNEDAIPWGEAITPEAMFDLICDGLFTIETPGVYLRFRRINEKATGCYQTLPITANRLFSDKPFETFAFDREYEIELTFANGFDQAAGKMTAFDPEGVALYVNGGKTGEAAPLAEDVDEMIVAGDLVVSAGTYFKAQPEAFLRGDVDNDGEVSAADARYALRAAVGLDDTAVGLDFSDPENRCYRAADVDGEPGIKASDARLILRAAVGLEEL